MPAATKESIEKVLEEEDLEPFDILDLPLPKEYLVEVMARNALEHAKNIQLVRVNIVGNKAVHNEAEVKRLTDLELSSRINLTKIKKDFPEALKRVYALAKREADKARSEEG